ncbi:MAG: Bug family tripartite tricarboxylate transporter substrate binding protein, partial [Hylemonella sp.]
MHRRQFVAACSALALGPKLANAQAWPNKPIRFVVPYIPGSAPDVLARAISERLSSALGQSLVIENRPGAGSNIGNEAIAKASPDGY